MSPIVRQTKFPKPVISLLRLIAVKLPHELTPSIQSEKLVETKPTKDALMAVLSVYLERSCGVNVVIKT